MICALLVCPDLCSANHDRQMARKHHQYSVAKSCTELEGKYLSMFTDKMRTEITETRTYNIEELKVLIAECEAMDKRIAVAGTGIPE